MSDKSLSFYEHVKLIPEISDSEIEEMLTIMQPVVYRGPDGAQEEGLYVVDTQGVNRRSTAFNWSPKLLRRARLAWGNGYDGQILTFHGFGAPSFFKPSLAEALASIRRFVPDGWRDVRFFWLDSRDLDSSNVLGSFHYCRCKLFTFEFPE